jgi:DNA-directed RNA polymerase subunit RPC12/RpoP
MMKYKYMKSKEGDIYCSRCGVKMSPSTAKQQKGFEDVCPECYWWIVVRWK